MKGGGREVVDGVHSWEIHAVREYTRGKTIKGGENIGPDCRGVTIHAVKKSMKKTMLLMLPVSKHSGRRGIVT